MAVGEMFGSLGEAAKRLGKGEQLIVCVPSDDIGGQVRAGLAASLSANAVSPISFDRTSGLNAAAAAKKELSRLPAKRYLLLDLAGKNFSQPRHETSLLHFHKELSPFLKRKGIRSLWIVNRSHCSERALAALKDFSAQFVEISLSDSHVFAQWRTARGIFSPVFFLPQRIRLNKPGLPLEPPPRSKEKQPVVPTVDASLIAQAVFAGRKLAYANRSFRTSFPETSTGSTTLREFLGKANGGLAKSLSSLPTDLLSPPVQGEANFEHEDGSRRDYVVSGARIAWNGKDAWHLSFTDITGRNEAVRALRDSEKTLGEIINRQAGPVSVVQDGRLVLVNDAFAALFGYPASVDLIGKEAALIVSSRGRKEFLDHVTPGIPGRSKAIMFEYNGKRVDGTRRTVELHGESILFAGIPAVLCHHTDLTELRKIEEESKRRVREQGILEHLSYDLHQSLEPLEVLNDGLRSALRWLGFETGGVYRREGDGTTLSLVVNEGLGVKTVTTLIVQHTQEGVTGLAVKTAEPLLLDVSAYPPYLPYKTLFESEGMKAVLYVPLISDGSVNALMMLCSSREASPATGDRALLASVARHAGDAFANALRYEELRTSEIRYRTAVESVPDVVYETTPTGALTLMSPRVEHLLGYPPDEFVRNPDLWRAIMHPDDRSEYSRRISNQEAGKDEFEIEYRLLPKGKASYRTVRDAVNYRRDASGKLMAISGIVSDITDRVAVSLTPTASGNAGAEVLESMQEGVVVYDRDLRYLEWNRAMELITGFPRDQVIGRNALDGPPRFELPDFHDLLHRALAGAPVSSEDVGYTRPEASEAIVLWCRYSPLRDTGGAIMGVIGTVTDVTHRKSLERELRESEETLRNVIDTMGDALMICDLQGKVWEVNREFTSLTGFSRSEVTGLTFPYPWLVEEEMPRFVVWLAALRERKFLRDFDMTWKRKDDHKVAISMNTTLLRNALAEPVAMLNLARDISERHRLAKELSAKSGQIEMLNRIISRANSTEEFSQIFDVIAEEVRAFVAYDHMNVCLLSEDRHHVVVHAAVGIEYMLPSMGTVVSMEQNVSGISIMKRQAVVVGNIDEFPDLGPSSPSAQAGMRSEISIPITVNERILGTFNLSSTAVNTFSAEDLSYLQPIADQIGALIDRTQLFQRVSDDREYIRNLLNSIESVVYTVDQNSTVREVNTAWRDFAVLQGTPELREESSVIGKPLDEIVVLPDLRDELRAMTPRLLDGAITEFSREFELGPGPRSFQLAVTPMAVHGKVTGLVFTHTDITDSKRTEAEIKKRNEELVALNAVASSINKSLNLDEVLAVAAQQVRRLVRADIVLCYLRDQQHDRLALAAYTGITAGLASKVRVLALEGSAAGSVIVERKPLIIESDLATDTRVTAEGREVYRELEAQSLIGFPLESKDRVLGAIMVAFKHRHMFAEQETRFLLLVGNQLGSALENVQLYAEVQAQVRRITLLYEIGRGLTGALDTKTILTVVEKELGKSLSFDRFVYFAAKGEEGGMEVQFEKSAARGETPPVSVSDPGILAAAGGRTYSSEGEGGRFLIAVPVLSKGRVVGILALAGTDPKVDAYLPFVESIANLTEIAMDRAQLYEDTVVKSEEIEHRNKELDDFTYVVSHDLKEPLITIEGYSKIVLNDYRDRVDEEAKGYLNSIVQSSQRMKQLIDDLLTLSRIGRVSDMQESLALEDVIGSVLHDFEFMLKESHATVNVPSGLPTVRYNSTHLGMVFRNLIANAIKFNRNPTPQIDIIVTEGEHEYTVAVRDNGIGIEQQHHEKIFVIFQRLHRSEEFRGTGAGLTIVKKIVENHHGRIWVESAVDRGTTFSFTIMK